MSDIIIPSNEQIREIREMIDHSEKLQSPEAMKAWISEFDRVIDKVIALGNNRAHERAQKVSE